MNNNERKCIFLRLVFFILFRLCFPYLFFFGSFRWLYVFAPTLSRHPLLSLSSMSVAVTVGLSTADISSTVRPRLDLLRAISCVIINNLCTGYQKLAGQRRPPSPCMNMDHLIAGPSLCLSAALVETTFEARVEQAQQPGVGPSGSGNQGCRRTNKPLHLAHVAQAFVRASLETFQAKKN